MNNRKSKAMKHFIKYEFMDIGGISGVRSATLAALVTDGLLAVKYSYERHADVYVLTADGRNTVEAIKDEMVAHAKTVTRG